MNRPIKFRAWDGYRKLMVPVDDGVVRLDEGKFVEIHPELRIMQFTGLHDKNGKEIYEGDILEESDNELIFEVKWHDEYGGYMMPREYDEEYIFSLGAIPTYVEIIGNIYENPDLLKV